MINIEVLIAVGAAIKSGNKMPKNIIGEGF